MTMTGLQTPEPNWLKINYDMFDLNEAAQLYLMNNHPALARAISEELKTYDKVGEFDRRLYPEHYTEALYKVGCRGPLCSLRMADYQRMVRRVRTGQSIQRRHRLPPDAERAMRAKGTALQLERLATDGMAACWD